MEQITSDRNIIRAIMTKCLSGDIYFSPLNSASAMKIILLPVPVNFRDDLFYIDCQSG